MSRKDILEKLRQILLQVFPQSKDKIEAADENSLLVEDLGLASLGMLCLVIYIEEEFSIEFTDLSFSDFKTVSNVIDYIEKIII